MDDTAFIDAILAEAGVLDDPAATTATYSGNGHHHTPFDMPAFLNKHGLRVQSIKADGQGQKYILAECPFDCSHRAPDSFVAVMASGALVFHCSHNSCSSYKWRDLREKLEPGCYSRPRTAARQHAPELDDGTVDSESVREDQGRTELANARRFIARHGERLRYVPQWGKWIVHVGTHWQIDDGCLVEQLARDVVEEVWAGVLDGVRFVERSTAASMMTFAKNTASAAGVTHFLQLARSEQGIPIKPSELDSNNWLFNVQNGTIDLRTGKIRAHDKADYITKLAPVVFAEGQDSPRWTEFVSEIMDGNTELIGFLQRLCGYCLTGSVQEHILPIFHGCGANGKSVFMGVLEALMGLDYAMHAPPDLLMVKRHESHPTERADLFGKRLVSCVETESGRQLAEALVKELTGGDIVRARRMREDFWQFAPTHKIIVSCNHRPIVRGTDNGIWRRLRLVPFDVVFMPQEQDKLLPEKLKAELSGILNWCLAGCMDWQRGGLQEPDSVLAATADYRDEQDVLADFFESKCVIVPNATVSGGRLYEAYSEWARANGHLADNATVFGRKLTERGFSVRKTMNGKVRIGIGLMSVPFGEA